jgi:uncharacterized Zn-binding protein involved in type VI secretion
MLPAARVTDMIVSPATLGVPTPIIPPGAPTVFIGKLPAARMGDTCGVDAILKGSATVFIGGLPAARIADRNGGWWSGDAAWFPNSVDWRVSKVIE